jgi:hypothetical protein
MTEGTPATHLTMKLTAVRRVTVKQFAVNLYGPHYQGTDWRRIGAGNGVLVTVLLLA